MKEDIELLKEDIIELPESVVQRLIQSAISYQEWKLILSTYMDAINKPNVDIIIDAKISIKVKK